MVALQRGSYNSRGTIKAAGAASVRPSRLRLGRGRGTRYCYYIVRKGVTPRSPCIPRSSAHQRCVWTHPRHSHLSTPEQRGAPQVRTARPSCLPSLYCYASFSYHRGSLLHSRWNAHFFAAHYFDSPSSFLFH